MKNTMAKFSSAFACSSHKMGSRFNNFLPMLNGRQSETEKRNSGLGAVLDLVLTEAISQALHEMNSR